MSKSQDECLASKYSYFCIINLIVVMCMDSVTLHNLIRAYCYLYCASIKTFSKCCLE